MVRPGASCPRHLLAGITGARGTGTPLRAAAAGSRLEPARKPTPHPGNSIREPRDREIVLRSLREGIDTSNATGRMVAGVLASLAELELELGRERRAAAREARRARGQAIGRPRALDKSKAALAHRMHSSGEPVSTIANTLAVSRATVYRVLAEADETDRNQGQADS